MRKKLLHQNLKVVFDSKTKTTDITKVISELLLEKDVISLTYNKMFGSVTIECSFYELEEKVLATPENPIEKTGSSKNDLASWSNIIVPIEVTDPQFEQIVNLLKDPPPPSEKLKNAAKALKNKS